MICRNILTTRQVLSSAAIEQLIAQRVADAIVAYEANQNSGNEAHDVASGSAGRSEHTTPGELTWWNTYTQSVGIDAAYETTWEELRKMMTEEKLNVISGDSQESQGKVTSSKLTKIQEEICMAHDLMDQVVRAKVAKDVDNKRMWEDELGGNPY
ncbi:hypothetical protein Tco_0613822 [Tanacetum coccineum]